MASRLTNVVSHSPSRSWVLDRPSASRLKGVGMTLGSGALEGWSAGRKEGYTALLLYTASPSQPGRTRISGRPTHSLGWGDCFQQPTLTIFQ